MSAISVLILRSGDVAKHKSETAANAVKRMNPSVNIIARENCVALNAENTFDDIYRMIDGVANASDNVETRIYTRRECFENKTSFRIRNFRLEFNYFLYFYQILINFDLIL